MEGRRPDPDELLARVREEEKESSRGKLTIFFGAAPGVGKTYTMLEAARGEIDDAGAGKSDKSGDVVVGIVETHGRYDTASLLMGLTLLPRRKVQHRGVELEELDLDAALARKPQLILLDELAHTNAPGSRHLKRWQDAAELLDAGIDVFTTLNVQHLESLNDVVAQITGVVVRETVPDAVFDKAYEVRVVDLPVGELLERLHAGKVYLPEQASRAIESFFREGNLIALRELALRRTAERVDAKMRGYKAAHGIEESWHTGERVLVCVSPSPYSARLVRAARRMATSLHAELVGVHVETPESLRMSARDRERLAANMRLVESLGGEPVTLRGEDAAVETVQYARKRNVTKIVLGKPTHSRWHWRNLLRPSFLDDIVRQSREIDVYVISGESSEGAGAPPREESPRESSLELAGAAAAAVVVSVTTLISWYGFGHELLPDVVMVYLLGVVVVSMRFGYVPSLLAAVLSVVAFDFFFVPPYFSFAVTDLRHTLTFAVMFLVAVVISHLTKRIRDQADAARHAERRTASLYGIARELGLVHSRDLLVRAAGRHLREVFAVRVAVLLPGAEARLQPAFADDGTLDEDGKDLGVAEWVWLNQRPAGAGTDTLPLARALFLPLQGSRGRVGVLALYASAETRLGDIEERHLLDTFAGLIGSALERAELADEARRAQLRAETEQLRNSLLSSVSHDLKTPLGVVTGATSSLLGEHGPRDPAVRRELLQTAHEEALRLNRLVRNLLDMTRLEAGALKVHKEMQPLEEVVGAALGRMDDRLRGREVHTDVPRDLPLVPFDSALIEQVLINLLENATKYSPAGSAIDVSARVREADVEVAVSDRGPGVDVKDVDRVFEKFYRVREGEGGGVGLGLTICRGIALAHGGRIWVEDRPGGGASFRFTLPLESGDADRPSPLPAETGSEVAMTEPRPLVLVVEDEPQMRKFVRIALESHDYRVVEAENAAEAIQQATAYTPDAILLDLGLPDMDGLELTRRLREWSTVPILVISAREQEDTKVRALDGGADDYLTKPFGAAELMARLRVALRHAARSRDVTSTVVKIGDDVEMDLAKRQVRVRGAEVHLTPIEYKLLVALVKHAGMVITHRHLLEQVWGPGHAHQTQYLRVYMTQLRHKLELDPARPKYLVTEPGIGYRLRAET